MFVNFNAIYYLKEKKIPCLIVMFVKTLFDDPRLVIFAGSWLVDGCSKDKQSERCVPRELH